MSTEKSYIGINGAFYGRYTDKTDKKGNVTTTFSPFGRAAKLVRIYRSVENNRYLLELNYNYGCDKRTLTIDRGEFADKNICKILAGNGVDVKSRTFDAFVDSITFQEDEFLENGIKKH